MQLKHGGIRGMHWGVRKTVSAQSSSSGQKSRVSNKQFKNPNKHKNYKNSVSKVRNTKFKDLNQKNFQLTFKQTIAGGLALGTLGFAINRLIAPTIDLAGKAMANRVAADVSSRIAHDIFKEAAKKGFETSAFSPL